MKLNYKPIEFEFEDIVELHADQRFIFLLRSSRVIEVFNPHTLEPIKTIPLLKADSIPLSLFADDMNLIIGFKDGTMEIRLIEEDYDLLRITDEEDASGPGSAAIQSIASSESYVLVKAHENGLLIYSKPSLLFYKWIMIGGHTTIVAHSIRHHLLFVLTETNDIHLLNFHQHRIWEQEVLAYNYVDIEFDGTFLYAATKTSVLVYIPDSDVRYQKQKLITQYNFNRTIKGLAFLFSELIVIFDNAIQVLNFDKGEGEVPIITQGKKLDIPQNLPVEKLKYSYYSTQSHDVEDSNLLVIGQHMDNECFLLKFSRLL